MILRADLAFWPLDERVFCESIDSLILLFLLEQRGWRASCIEALSHYYRFLILSGGAGSDYFFKTLQLILTTVDHTSIIIDILGLSASTLLVSPIIIAFFENISTTRSFRSLEILRSRA